MKYCFILLLAASMLFASCEVFIDCGEHASCEEAMDNLYSENCALFIDGEQISKSSAIDGCEDDLELAKDYDCDGEYYDLLDCLFGIDECDECADEFDDYNDCYNEN